MFKRSKALTSPTQTANQLRRGYKWLDLFRRASDGEARPREIVSRYDRLIQIRRDKEYWRHLFYVEQKWIQKLRNRPIMTGKLLRASSSNRPLPILKPQPHHITMMIFKRRLKREMRINKVKDLVTWSQDLEAERLFEEGLLGDESVYSLKDGKYQAWYDQGYQLRTDISAAVTRERNLVKTPVPESLKQLLKEARREKIANKTRERERERRGEVLPRTIKRRRGGPPAHVLCHMSPKRRQMDRVSREVGEVGYVGMMKRKMGMQMRDDETWRKEEEIAPERKEKVEAMEAEFRRESERRRRADALN